MTELELINSQKKILTKIDEFSDIVDNIGGFGGTIFKAQFIALSDGTYTQSINTPTVSYIVSERATYDELLDLLINDFLSGEMDLILDDLEGGSFKGVWEDDITRKKIKVLSQLEDIQSPFSAIPTVAINALYFDTETDENNNIVSFSFQLSIQNELTEKVEIDKPEIWDNVISRIWGVNGFYQEKLTNSEDERIVINQEIQNNYYASS